MLAISEPIGRFVALANLEKTLFSQKPLEQDIANLIDLITIRIKDQSLEEVSNSLLENIFDLRLDLVEWLVDNNTEVNFYLEPMNKHISKNLQLASFSSLAETVSKVLLTYEKIVSPIFKTLPVSFKDTLEDIQKNKLKYGNFKVFSLHPSPQIKYLKNWMDASLQLEIGIILADLILTDQLEFPKERIKSELIEFLYQTTTKFGAYSIFTGFWIPDSDDISNLTNSMKILAATTELDHQSCYKTSKEGFFNMINN